MTNQQRNCTVILFLLSILHSLCPRGVPTSGAFRPSVLHSKHFEGRLTVALIHTFKVKFVRIIIFS